MKYIIGDIHGQIYKLQDLIRLTELDATEYIFLGDYIDRGEHSREVIDYLINLSKKIKCIFLKGNHEDIWLQYLQGDKSWLDFILEYGGIETIKSYTGKQDVIPQDMFKIHQFFFKKLIYYYELKDYLCVHAGINPGFKDKDISSHNKEDLLWTKEDFVNSKFLYKGKKIIFGHTSFKEPYIDNYKIGIDTTMKTITAFCIEKKYLINNEGRCNFLNEQYSNSRCPS